MMTSKVSRLREMDVKDGLSNWFHPEEAGREMQYEPQ
jgi:hypothetical protein